MARIRTFAIGRKQIGPGAPVYIIAEAGVNHNGDVGLAERMIKVAAEAGADAVKFQAFKSELLASPGAPLADYQKKTVRTSRTQRTMLKELELAPDDFKVLKAVCDSEGIEFLASPFDLDSLKMLLDLGVRAVKVASPEMTDTPLLEAVASARVPALVSTGAATLDEIKDAVAALHAGKLYDIALFHCVSAYPAPYDQTNLRAIVTLRDYFRVPIGYSDHSPGLHVGVAAVALGAHLLEKHFTLDRKLPGPDQPLSLEPSELFSLVTAVRQIENALGNGEKIPQPAEVNVRESARKSLVTTRAVKKGDKITAAMLTTKRPATGIEPRFIRKVIGRRAKCDIGPDTIITWDMI
jgi:N-acetylneuraminate synthase